MDNTDSTTDKISGIKMLGYIKEKRKYLQILDHPTTAPKATSQIIQEGILIAFLEYTQSP